MRNLYLVIASSFLVIFLLYTLLFAYTFFNFSNEFKHTFKTIENLNFHEKYSKKVHHIRDEFTLNLLFKKSKLEDLLFTTINDLNDKEKIVLLQGDSWIEQLTFMADRNFVSVDLIQKFGSKNNVGFINAGTASYSPSLMNVQLNVLQEDFQILPDIVITYIDQTDIGDEICRYKNNKVYKNGILDSVPLEKYIMYKDLFKYSQIYGSSRIYLKNTSRFLKTFQLINFKFKYGLARSSIRFYRKYISNSQTDKEKLKKCYMDEIEKYLIKPNNDGIKYFANSIREYLKNVDQKGHIKKLIIVTFPHKKHFYKNSNQQPFYKFNVSDVVDKVVQDKKNVTHINFSKMLLNKENFDYESIWLKDDAHLNSDSLGNLFIKKILDELSKYMP